MTFFYRRAYGNVLSIHLDIYIYIYIFNGKGDFWGELIVIDLMLCDGKGNTTYITLALMKLSF